MVLLFVLMVLLCAMDGLSDLAILWVKKYRAPRLRVARARQYRFN